MSLEFVASFTVLLLLLIFIARIFLWFVGTVVDRHRAFEQKRTNITDVTFYDRFNDTHTLKVFK